MSIEKSVLESSKISGLVQKLSTDDFPISKDNGDETDNMV